MTANLRSPTLRRGARVRRIADGLEVLRGATNVGVLRRGGRVLLVNSASTETLARAGVRPEEVDWVLLTHHFRSTAEGARELAAAGAKIAVPEAERSLIEDAESFWAADSAYRVHGYHFHPLPRTLRESLPVARGLKGGEALEWQGLRIRALEAPGPTDGGLSYLVSVDGVTAGFVGDLMSGPGRLREFHTLQGRRPMPDGNLMQEYHGFGERTAQVLGSLDAVVNAGAGVLVPSRGEVMDDPRGAVEALRANVAACMADYCRISAANWYFAGVRPEWPADVTHLRSRLRPLPSWVRELGGTTRAVVADGGEAFVMDCWGDVPDQIREEQDSGRLGPVEALWITHYHDDHVGSVGALKEQQCCPVIAHESMADILRRPDAYLMPCLDPNPVAVDRVTRDGQSWEWRGFRLTAYTFPGQTILDAALLVERGGERVLFVGDSLGPGGIDDYCAPNRNLLGPGLGYDRCLAVVQSLPRGTVMVNPHVEGAFAFTPGELREMRSSLAKRRELFRRLLDWDDPNYGLDPQWVRCDPYFRRARPGETVSWAVHVRNYSAGSRTASVTLRAPRSWRVTVAAGTVRVPAGKERIVTLSASVPRDCRPGRAVAGFALRYGRLDLLETAEGVVEVGE